MVSKRNWTFWRATFHQSDQNGRTNRFIQVSSRHTRLGGLNSGVGGRYFVVHTLTGR